MKIRFNDMPPEFRQLAERLGMDLSVKLIECCGGETIYVPTANSVQRRERNRQMYEMFRSGKSTREIAHAYGMSDTQIRDICRQMRDEHMSPAVDLDKMINEG